MKSIKQQYIDLTEGKMSRHNFMRNLRMTMPQYVTNVTSFGDAVKILKNKGILNEAKEVLPSGKELYARFEKEVPANRQEITTGIHIEHEIYPDKSYEDIVKLVVKNLKKHPHYYTNWKLSGVEGEEPKIEGSVNPKDREMEFAKNDNIVNKRMGMKTVKGIEKDKASANKAKKETNSIVKGVEEFSLTAKTVRGVKKMDSTGEKMKKIVMKEGNILTEKDIIKLIREIISK